MTDILNSVPTLPTSDSPILEVRDLTVTFPNSNGDVKAVRGVNYSVRPGEFLGIVGESGSGKSVSSMAVMGLLPVERGGGRLDQLPGQRTLGHAR